MEERREGGAEVDGSVHSGSVAAQVSLTHQKVMRRLAWWKRKDHCCGERGLVEGNW